MAIEATLINKDGFLFSIVEKNHYKLTFSMENKNIILSKIIDFGLIKLIYDLNSDVYEKIKITKLNESEIIAELLMKHFFEDLGLPQRFSFIHMRKIVEENRIIFHSQSIKSHRPEGMPADSELMSLQDLECVCNIITPHRINFNVDVFFDSNMNVPNFAEKMIGMILLKIFTRVKQFIENVRM
jgi:hypothetical protein